MRDKLVTRPRPEKHGFNWAEGFTAYCNGATLEEVAATIGASIEQVRSKCHLDEWNALRGRLHLSTNTDAGGVQLSEGAEHRLELITRNREKNLAVFVELQDHLLAQVKALKAGTMKMEKHFHNKGSIVTVIVPPSTGDWVNIATYARTIADGSYRAIGDITANEKGNANPLNPNQLPQAPQTIIILPASIAAPRQERVLSPSSAQVIDLKDVVVSDVKK